MNEFIDLFLEFCNGFLLVFCQPLLLLHDLGEHSHHVHRAHGFSVFGCHKFRNVHTIGHGPIHGCPDEGGANRGDSGDANFIGWRNPNRDPILG